MKRQNQFGTVGEIDSRAVQQITAMIEDMRRVVRLLEDDIAAAETRARVHDKGDVAYPMDARAKGERRDNLTKTIASLSERLPESRRAA